MAKGLQALLTLHLGALAKVYKRRVTYLEETMLLSALGGTGKALS